ncbi:MAG: D-serine ammonia-lyase [Flexilinea sp.]|nr:D-serine ammonia-lyase [Flexilinea sp.]
MISNDPTLFSAVRAGEPVFWRNPDLTSRPEFTFTAEDIEDAEARLQRFAPWIAQRFPETAPAEGIIESPLTPIPEIAGPIGQKDGFRFTGTLLLKRDDSLPVSGSVKARGGIYAVLKHTEDLLMEAGLLFPDSDYRALSEDPVRSFLKGKKLAVGSTGNLGLSIGIMGAALGYQTSVFISREAREWKKQLLRKKGVRVVESEQNYEAAVAAGRAESEADPDSFFIDDERSEDLYLGYAAAAARLKKQLDILGIPVDTDHPLYVYLPCGVGGGPGGITFGLKMVYGSAVRCFFAEPTQAPCMLLALATGKGSEVCAADFGLSGITAADGLAVTRASGLVYREMRTALDGCFTLPDEDLFSYLRMLDRSSGIRIEPSACAGFAGLKYTAGDPNATHIVWATGGGMVPNEEMERYLS